MNAKSEANEVVLFKICRFTTATEFRRVARIFQRAISRPVPGKRVHLVAECTQMHKRVKSYVPRRESFLWAQSVLRSRTHKVDVQDESGEWHDTMCLVPYADLMNTAFETDLVNVECRTDETIVGIHSTFDCYTTKEVRAGSQVSPHLYIIAAYLCSC